MGYGEFVQIDHAYDRVQARVCSHSTRLSLYKDKFTALCARRTRDAPLTLKLRQDVITGSVHAKYAVMPVNAVLDG